MNKYTESHFSWEKNLEENGTLVSSSLEIKKKVVNAYILNLISWLASALHVGSTWYHVNLQLMGSPVPRQDKWFAPYPRHLK